MNTSPRLPRLLIIDDLFGRNHLDRRNEERANLCGQYLIRDVTGDEIDKPSTQIIKKPVAEAVFCRGQKPARATIGDRVYNDLDGVLRTIREGWIAAGPRWAMVLLDLCFYTGEVTEKSNQRVLGMPEGNPADDDPERYFGLTILNTIHYEFPDLPVVMLSSKPRHEVSREFTYAGALGFLARDSDDSPELLKDYLYRHGLIADRDGEIVGHSKSLLLALRSARRAALSRQNVLLRGERGTGKNLLARYIHRSGDEGRNRPFIEVNSAALSPTLYASELFGIERRVATGVEAREGLIRAASGGDLFFDEIGDMLPETQSGILRILETHEITPVGSLKNVPVEVRFLSATNIDIEGKAAVEAFRSDLLDRLRQGGTVFLPSLRERVEDIPLIVEKLVSEAEAANPAAMRRQIDPESIAKVCLFDWPGNVRQLRSCIYKAVNDHPDVEHLVPGHIEVPFRENTSGSNVYQSPVAAKTQRSDQLGVASIDDLVDLLNNFELEEFKSDQLHSRLPKLQAAYARLIAHYLRAILKATSQPTPDNPEGKVRIHPAVKLMEGNSQLSASQAADVIKRLLSLNPESVASLLEDPILKSAYETALRLRPRQQRAKS